jgi:Protein of unknown function (DUF2911)
MALSKAHGNNFHTNPQNRFDHMNWKIAFLASALAAFITSTATAQQGSQRPSPHDTTGTRVSNKVVTIYYGRPSAKGRKVWGDLVPWEKAWRLGADEATTLITQTPLVIGGTAVPAGAYTLYMVPSETGTSKLAISKTLGGWGIAVDEKNDLARVDLTKATVDAPVEQLTLTLGRSGAATALKIAWANNVYTVNITAGQ